MNDYPPVLSLNISSFPHASRHESFDRNRDVGLRSFRIADIQKTALSKISRWLDITKLLRQFTSLNFRVGQGVRLRLRGNGK